MSSAVQSDISVDAAVRPWVMKQFRRHTGSALAGVFGAAAFDEVALASVAAAVDRTGRFTRNFADRGVRSGAATMLVFFGDADDRAAEAQRLKTLHRDVRGRGTGDFADVRYSALAPELWKWIGVSGLLVPIRSFTPATGITMRAAERDAAYRMLVEAFSVLDLSAGAGALPQTYADAMAYYDDMVANRLGANPFLDEAVSTLGKFPLPTLGIPGPMRAAVTPAWLLARPAVGRFIKVCSFGVMHPKVREMTGFQWNRRHEVEFALYTTAVQLAWRLLPDSVVLVPLAHNRMQYEKIVAAYRSVGLESFAPGD
ncbi:MAG: oxygenase MpaB family protein [Mycobacterium sp.]